VALETDFLDAGGVLLFPSWTRVAAALGRQGIHATPEALAAAEPHARRVLDDQQVVGSTTDAARGWLFFDLILERAGIAPSDATKGALAELHAYHTANNLWEFVPDEVYPALSGLRAMGLKLTIVSNANGTLCSHLARIGLDEYVDCVLDSYDERVEKPDPRLFEIALQRSNARKESTIHVGDLYNIDIIGARNAGLRAVLLDQANLRPDADCPRVRSLTELVARIKSGEFDGMSQ
jgi:HAD superfamily hydrolase (TIGR01549 family)